MMLAPTTKKSTSRDRTLVEEDTKPTFENSDNGSNDKVDVEDGKQLPSKESNKDGDDDNGSGAFKMDRKKIILIGLGMVLLICFLGGILGANAKRKKRNDKISSLAEQSAERATKPPAAPLEISTKSPTKSPTGMPTITVPSPSPTILPAPSNKPIASPTGEPTANPTWAPQPSASPTISPEPTNKPTASPTGEPTTGPTISPKPTALASESPTADYVAMIQTFLSGNYAVDVFSGSKAAKTNAIAIQWLATEARETNLIEFDGHYVQRFILLAQDLSLQGAKDVWDPPRNAQKGVDACDWDGIVCDSENWVREILWSYQEGKKGFISPELRHLVGSLKVLDLSNNEMKEEIPEELYQLTNLEKLFLFNNQLKGTISSKIGDLDSITHFHLSHNKLKGPFPVEVSSDSDGIRPLVYFNVYSNELTGTLPEDMRLRQVTYFDVGRNYLSGTLPVTLGEKFVSLRHLHVDHNEFTGTLPLSYNTVGNGRLESLSIDHNYLTGRIPGERDLYNKLVQYTLHSNQFDSMDSNVCRSEIPRGEMVELRADCAVCICNGYFDICEVQCLEEPSESPTESPTFGPDDDDN